MSKVYVPSYYHKFHCIAEKCKHTCCKGWEIDIDEDKLSLFESLPDIKNHIDYEDVPHFKLLEEERCPFLRTDGLCQMIMNHGEAILCQICRDHPRFRLYWADRTELSLGLVCEEAARIILSEETPLNLVFLTEDEEIPSEMDDEEKWLFSIRNTMIEDVPFIGWKARLKEYLIFRHLSDALYDGRVDARLLFIEHSFNEIWDLYEKSNKTFEDLIEIVVKWSYDVEYDEEELERRISSFDN